MTTSGGTVIDTTAFQNFSPCTLADVLTKEQVMDIGVRPLWQGTPRVSGPAYTVRCAAGDNLMLHAAIYRAEPGSVIVMEAGDVAYAVAGGNVCAVAQKRGVVAFVIDGVIRDLAEIRKLGFPVFARGVSPIPGAKEVLGELGGPVQCGGVRVEAGDIVVGDGEGVVVVPQVRAEAVLEAARARAAKEETDLTVWETTHRARTEALLKSRGFSDEDSAR